mgnify:CR=1 FL=1
MLGRLKESLSCYEKVLTLDSQNQTALYYKHQVLEKLEKEEKSKQKKFRI